MALYNPKVKLEEQVNDVVRAFNRRTHVYVLPNQRDYCDYDQLTSIEEWGAYYDVFRQDENFASLRVIKDLIRQAPSEECLTSPSGFIREYKQWLISTT